MFSVAALSTLATVVVAVTAASTAATLCLLAVLAPDAGARLRAKQLLQGLLALFFGRRRR